MKKKSFAIIGNPISHCPTGPARPAHAIDRRPSLLAAGCSFLPRYLNQIHMCGHQKGMVCISWAFGMGGWT